MAGTVPFIEVARQFFATGAESGVADWITVAAPVLPEAERHATITLVLCSLFAKFESSAQIRQPRRTLQ
jgi:hypothetical protein